MHAATLYICKGGMVMQIASTRGAHEVLHPASYKRSAVLRIGSYKRSVVLCTGWYQRSAILCTG